MNHEVNRDLYLQELEDLEAEIQECEREIEKCEHEIEEHADYIQRSFERLIVGGVVLIALSLASTSTGIYALTKVRLFWGIFGIGFGVPVLILSVKGLIRTLRQRRDWECENAAWYGEKQAWDEMDRILTDRVQSMYAHHSSDAYPDRKEAA